MPVFIDAVLLVAMGFPLCAGCGRTAFATSEKKEVSVERVAELCPFVKGMCGWRIELAV